MGLLAVGSSSCSSEPSGGTLDRIRASGKLRWGGDMQGGEPYVSEDPNRPGKLVGFEVDLAEAIAREMGVRAEFVQNDWSNLVPSLERGTFDIAMNGLEVTKARVGRVLFTRPYYIFQMRLMARHGDARVRPSLRSLRGLRVGTLANSQSWEALQDTGAEVLPYEGVEEPYIDLEVSRTDAVLLDHIIADRYGVPHTKLRVVGDLGEGYYSIAVRRGDDGLRTALDRALEAISKRGALRRILRKHGIDDAAQARLATWSDTDTTRMISERAAAQRAAGGTQADVKKPFTWHHFMLFLQGALVTLVVSTAAMALAIPLGILLALARLYLPRTPFAWIAGAYVEVFRGTPVLLQLYLLYYGLPGLWEGLKLDAWTAAIVGLGLNYAAYEAEIYRGGILAVPKGQLEAAWSLGMSTPLAVRRVILPQAFRIALPGVTNDYIALLKDSSLVSVITVVELTKRMTITAVDVRSWLVPGLLCALLYFSMSYPLSILARKLEARLHGESR
ncbi:MAG: ABC transporter permease subunit [Deltaproteobacteria bacterium]|nr:ABC transporter permease subunit [Deltaproteobacteria bacterium]